MTDAVPNPHYVTLAAELVSAYVSRNSVPAIELPGLIQSVHKGFVGLSGSQQPTPEAAPLVPAVPVRKSVQDQFLICLEDGKHFKSLRRHLLTRHGMTPDGYRAKWGLPSTYPMVAPGYAAQRSVLAKSIGLGRKAPINPVERSSMKSDVESDSAASLSGDTTLT